MLLLIPTIAAALDECQATTAIINIPCRVTGTWEYPGACGDYNVTIHNENGTAITNTTMDVYTGQYCKFTFNESVIGSYTYTLSSGDSGGINVVEEESMIVAILILLPLLLSFLFIIGAAITDPEEHPVLKLFLFLISIIPFFISMHIGIISVAKFYDFPELQNLIGNTVYWIGLIFFVIIIYFLIYIITKMFQAIAKRKSEQLHY